VAAGQMMRGCRNRPSGRNTFNRRDQRALHCGLSVLSQVILANQHFDGVKNAEKNFCLVHPIHVLWEDGRIGQLVTNDGKPMPDFVFDLPVISLPVNRS